MTSVGMMRGYMMKRVPNADFAHAVSSSAQRGCLVRVCRFGERGEGRGGRGEGRGERGEG